MINVGLSSPVVFCLFLTHGADAHSAPFSGACFIWEAQEALSFASKSEAMATTVGVASWSYCCLTCGKLRHAESLQLEGRDVVGHGGVLGGVEGSQSHPGAVTWQPYLCHPLPPASLPHASVELLGALLRRLPEGECRARFCAAANHVVVKLEPLFLMHLEIEAAGDALGAMELAAVRNVVSLCIEEVENGGGGGRKAIMMPRRRLTHPTHSPRRRLLAESQSLRRRLHRLLISHGLPPPPRPSAPTPES